MRGVAAVRAASRVDLPALGRPTRPMSAISRSSSRSHRSSAGSPFCAWCGVRWVAVAKWTLPRPPRPPRATITPLARRHEVGQQIAGVAVEDGRARRDRQIDVAAGPAVTLGARAGTAGGRPEVVLEAEVLERRLAHVDPQVDRPAATPVAAVRPAAWHVGLASERGRPGAAFARGDPDRDVVKEHRRRS